MQELGAAAQPGHWGGCTQKTMSSLQSLLRHQRCRSLRSRHEGVERGGWEQEEGKQEEEEGVPGHREPLGGECRNEKPMVSAGRRAPTLPASIGSLPGFGC